MANFNQRLKRLEGKLPKKDPLWVIIEICGYLELQEERKKEVEALCYKKYPEAKQASESGFLIFIAGPPHNYECNSDFSFERDVRLFNGSTSNG